MTDAKVSRSLIERAIEFLKQYAEKLEGSKYPPDSYKKDSIEDIAQQLERAKDG